MPSYYDDNFGLWQDTDEPGMREFYHKVQQTNTRKRCQGCGAWVSIQPHYAYCNSCADTIERGGELPGYDPATNVDDPDAELDDIEDHAEGYEDERPIPPAPCHVCGETGEDCTCEHGSTDADGEPNFCYECGSHIDSCHCGYPGDDYDW